MLPSCYWHKCACRKGRHTFSTCAYLFETFRRKDDIWALTNFLPHLIFLFNFLSRKLCIVGTIRSCGRRGGHHHDTTKATLVILAENRLACRHILAMAKRYCRYDRTLTYSSYCRYDETMTYLSYCWYDKTLTRLSSCRHYRTL